MIGQSMKRVFVSHPYTDNPQINIYKADKICKRLLREGVLPISPLHLFAFMSHDKGIRRELMSMCFDLILSCDELQVYGDSPGTQEEVKFAWAHGIKVVDCSVENFDRYMRERSEVRL